MPRLARHDLPRTLPLGRLADLRARPDAELIAYTIPVGLFAEYRLTRYASRRALEAFCRDGSAHHALVKTPTPADHVTNSNVQRAVS